ncbi:MAG: DUF1294 domain-containing protein [Lacrimispora sphenoides]
MSQAVILYVAVINLLAFLTMGADKHQAKKGGWRISEKNLFLLAAMGGSVGGIAAMYLFRHKTLHKRFTVGFPLILALQCAVLVYLFIWRK